MEVLKCECCGSTTLTRQPDGLYKCEFCNSLFLVKTDRETSKSNSNMRNTSRPVYDRYLSVEDISKVIEIAVETGQLSTSIVQRNLGLGYGKASGTIDKLEEIGIVEPFEFSKLHRCLIYRCLITKDMWIKTKDEILEKYCIAVCSSKC